MTGAVTVSGSSLGAAPPLFSTGESVKPQAAPLQSQPFEHFTQSADAYGRPGK